METKTFDDLNIMDDQALGEPVPNWHPAKLPTTDTMEGNSCRLEYLTPDHAPDLWESNTVDPTQKNFNYLAYGPFDSLESYRGWVISMSGKPDPFFYAIIDKKLNKAVGVASYLGSALKTFYPPATCSTNWGIHCCNPPRCNEFSKQSS